MSEKIKLNESHFQDKSFVRCGFGIATTNSKFRFVCDTCGHVYNGLGSYEGKENHEYLIKKFNGGDVWFHGTCTECSKMHTRHILEASID